MLVLLLLAVILTTEEETIKSGKPQAQEVIWMAAA